MTEHDNAFDPGLAITQAGEAARRRDRGQTLQTAEEALTLMERRALNAEAEFRRARASGDKSAAAAATDHRRRLIDLVARLRHEIDCMRGEG